MRRGQDKTRSEANQRFREGNYEEALATYHDLFRTNEADRFALEHAIECALRCSRNDLVYELFVRACALYPTEETLIAKAVQALASSNKASKALATLAMHGDLSVMTKIRLNNLLASSSPTCLFLLHGVLVDGRGGQQCFFRTETPIPTGTCVLREKPFLPWTKNELQDDDCLSRFIGAEEEDLDSTEGLYPRSYDERLEDVEVLQGLGDRIRQLDPSLSRERVEKLRLVLSRCKMCAFETGLHHLSAFFDHSCSPNCEVRGEENIEVYSIRDVAAGEELTIAYSLSLDYPVEMRRIFLQTNFGFRCECPRCRAEQELGEPCSEEDFMRYQTNMVAALNGIQDDPLYTTLLRSDIEGWMQISWKVVDVLGKLSLAYSEYLRTAYETVATAPRDRLRSTCETLVSGKVVENTVLLYRLRSEYLPESSYSLDPLREILFLALSIAFKADASLAVQGLDDPDGLQLLWEACELGKPIGSLLRTRTIRMTSTAMQGAAMVVVAEAKGVKDLQSSEPPNVYCKISKHNEVVGNAFFTEICRGTSDPVWNQQFAITIDDPDTSLLEITVCNSLNKRESRILGEEHQGTVIHHDFEIILTKEDQDDQGGRSQNGTLRLMLHYVTAADVHHLYDEDANLGGPFKGMNSKLLVDNEEEMMRGRNFPNEGAEMTGEGKERMDTYGNAAHRPSQGGSMTASNSFGFQRVPSTLSVASSTFDDTEFARTSSNFSLAMSSSQTWESELEMTNFSQSSKADKTWLRGTRGSLQTNAPQRNSSSRRRNENESRPTSESQDTLLMSVAILEANHIPSLHGFGKHLRLYTLSLIYNSGRVDGWFDLHVSEETTEPRMISLGPLSRNLTKQQIHLILTFDKPKENGWNQKVRKEVRFSHQLEESLRHGVDCMSQEVGVSFYQQRILPDGSYEFPMVREVLPDSPIKGLPHVSISAGDFLVDVDGINTHGLSLEQVLGYLAGPEGEPVTMIFRSPTGG
ncbi:hypothetical protein GUITHDRAFT_137874 [Guillardia theta CCMP2712]|uniref:Uncharacterized protein n=1 Tax=Guillardia theta (strain CCMP2712) TaxID=905079 RepID=L1JFG6_GUITC|nr:hypothetical protein GUITHDRAFT_137874 [Guillardia theta CCMP2712]EKX46879.1 hypothetical protein GUITHDRAFT_137874 [Guillardia theta CCMP2712]|eukprot:XP_005833859.1 hypothetical protein GUITHDRAFT_137874 [Guillardia theta CCMP2712]